MSQDVEARPAYKRENQAVGDDDDGEGFFGFLLKICSVILIFITFPISIWMCVRMVQEYQRAVIFSVASYCFKKVFNYVRGAYLHSSLKCPYNLLGAYSLVTNKRGRLGRVKKGNAVGPGLFFIIPCLDSIQVVDLRTVSFDVPPQVLQIYETNLLCKPRQNVASFKKALHELLADRERTSTEILQQLDEATDPWGIQVERVEVKDVRLPQQLQRAMAAEAEAAREARAKVIAAEGEQKASRALKEASLIISESPSALQLRYLQTLTQIAAERNSTIIFPLPIDMMSNFMNGKAAQPATVSQM